MKGTYSQFKKNTNEEIINDKSIEKVKKLKFFSPSSTPDAASNKMKINSEIDVFENKNNNYTSVMQKLFSYPEENDEKIISTNNKSNIEIVVNKENINIENELNKNTNIGINKFKKGKYKLQINSELIKSISTQNKLRLSESHLHTSLLDYNLIPVPNPVSDQIIFTNNNNTLKDMKNPFFMSRSNIGKMHNIQSNLFGTTLNENSAPEKVQVTINLVDTTNKVKEIKTDIDENNDDKKIDNNHNDNLNDTSNNMIISDDNDIIVKVSDSNDGDKKNNNDNNNNDNGGDDITASANVIEMTLDNKMHADTHTVTEPPTKNENITINIDISTKNNIIEITGNENRENDTNKDITDLKVLVQTVPHTAHTATDSTQGPRSTYPTHHPTDRINVKYNRATPQLSPHTNTHIDTHTNAHTYVHMHTHVHTVRDGQADTISVTDAIENARTPLSALYNSPQENPLWNITKEKIEKNRIFVTQEARRRLQIRKKAWIEIGNR